MLEHSFLKKKKRLFKTWKTTCLVLQQIFSIKTQFEIYKNTKITN